MLRRNFTWPQAGIHFVQRMKLLSRQEPTQTLFYHGTPQFPIAHWVRSTVRNALNASKAYDRSLTKGVAVCGPERRQGRAEAALAPADLIGAFGRAQPGVSAVLVDQQFGGAVNVGSEVTSGRA